MTLRRMPTGTRQPHSPVGRLSQIPTYSRKTLLLLTLLLATVSEPALPGHNLQSEVHHALEECRKIRISVDQSEGPISIRLDRIKRRLFDAGFIEFDDGTPDFEVSLSVSHSESSALPFVLTARVRPWFGDWQEAGRVSFKAAPDLNLEAEGLSKTLVEHLKLLASQNNFGLSLTSEPLGAQLLIQQQELSATSTQTFTTPTSFNCLPPDYVISGIATLSNYQPTPFSIPVSSRNAVIHLRPFKSHLSLVVVIGIGGACGIVILFIVLLSRRLRTEHSLINHAASVATKTSGTNDSLRVAGASALTSLTETVSSDETSVENEDSMQSAHVVDSRQSSGEHRASVFVCYSHQDNRWVERLQVHLRPLVRHGIIDLWDDSRIQSGTNWRREIDWALSRAGVAVLLVSADFLASDFIANCELPPILNKAASGGLRVISIIVGPSLFESNVELSQYQAVNSPERPLSRLSKHDSEKVLVDVARTIAEQVRRQSS